MVAYSIMSWPINESSNIATFCSILILKISRIEVSHVNLSYTDFCEFWFVYLFIIKEGKLYILPAGGGAGLPEQFVSAASLKGFAHWSL